MGFVCIVLTQILLAGAAHSKNWLWDGETHCLLGGSKPQCTGKERVVLTNIIKNVR